MLKKRMAAGVVALAMMSTLGLSACSNGSDSSSNSASSGSASGSIPKPDVSCDIPATNLDDSKIDTSKVEGEITFQTQGLKTDFGDFFTKKIKEFEDANPGVKIKWTDQAGGAEFDQTITAQATNCQMADVVNVPSSTILALSKSNVLMDLDVKALGIGDKFVQTIWDSTKLGAVPTSPPTTRKFSSAQAWMKTPLPRPWKRCSTTPLRSAQTARVITESTAPRSGT